MLDVDYDLIKEHVYYDETSPTCLRNLKATRNRPAHSVAGCLGSDPKRSAQVKIAGTYYRLIRVVWVINNGNIPKEKYVIPKDNNPRNLKIENLVISDTQFYLSDKNSRVKDVYKSIADPQQHIVNPSRFYVYVHKDCDGVIRYVGKGSGGRAYSSKSRGAAWEDVFKEFSKENVEILKDGLTENEAFSLERTLIKECGPTITNIHRNPRETKEISYEDASQLVYYDETSPTFLRWKVDRVFGSWRFNKDAVAGHCSSNPETYSSVRIYGKSYRVHRVIWVLFNGGIDSGSVIDHIDRDRHNNKISNLRLVNQSQNSKNRRFKPNEVGERNISKKADGYAVLFSVNRSSRSTFFGASRFGSLDAALKEAIKFRDDLVEKGIIILD